MILPLINQFYKPYELWEYRDATLEECKNILDAGNIFPFHSIPERLIRSINNHFEAAKYILEVGSDNGIETHVEDVLYSSQEYVAWVAKMPNQTPQPLYDYKNNYPEYNKQDVDQAINSLGIRLSDGQTFFHGGLFDDFGKYQTSKPLSVSFCPQVALRSAEWRGKAYERNQIDIFVLTVKNAKTNVYIYNLNEELGNEKEVLFASGASLNFIKRTLISNNYRVSTFTESLQEFEKEVPVYVVELEIS